MITVSMIGLHTFEVFVVTDKETRHEVTLQPKDYQRLTGGKITHEWLIVQSFRFLLEREPHSAILPAFDLLDIKRYYPEYEVDMSYRLQPQR